jgi:hypothetical protein
LRERTMRGAKNKQGRCGDRQLRTKRSHCLLPRKICEFDCEYLNPLGDEPQALVRRMCEEELRRGVVEWRSGE